ncbi:hypothetical protein PoB_004944200 [Plakobranchus ocellatus]|uniref:Uncharacterized protein n=1 Tax=Plakobranchus ocellatus TaxID=259542 RepID=A0AAV4BV79_9GAST|nr:hypothetical protein PoB_004944200 [Plakobranchus ocellatus]
MAPPFPLSNRATDVIPGCKIQRIAPTLRQVADLMCARTKEREYFKTCIVGHVNCCLQCGPTLNSRQDGLMSQLLCSTQLHVGLIICVPRLALWFVRQRIFFPLTIYSLVVIVVTYVVVLVDLMVAVIADVVEAITTVVEMLVRLEA